MNFNRPRLSAKAWKVALLALLPSILMLVVGCRRTEEMTTSAVSGMGAQYDRQASVVQKTFDRLILNHEYQVAQRAYNDKHWALAVSTYENLHDRMPEGPRRENIFFNQGVAHFQLKNYHDARDQFLIYQERYPNGQHTESASEYIMRIAVELAGITGVATERLEQARRDLDAMLQTEREHPSDPEIKFQTANLYYELGQYKEAGRYYYEAQQLEASYRERELIEKRLYINDEGDPEALTPGTIQQFERDRNPVVIFDIKMLPEANNADAFAGRKVFVIVTGKIRNQSQRPIRGTELEIRFLNATRETLDVVYHNIGLLHPGDVRAFVVQAGRYDNIFNITSVEIIPRVTR